MIGPINSATILTTLQIHGYFILFFLMFLEGPLITYAASFLASQGVFNIYIILLLSIFGNLIPDIIFFLSGKYSRTKTMEKVSNFFGLNQSRIEKIENGFSNHAGKSIIFFKLIPGFAVPGLMLAGFSKVPFKKFFIISVLFNVFSAILFGFLGFYSGITISSLLKYLKLEKYILIVLTISVVIIYFIIRYFQKKLNKIP